MNMGVCDKVQHIIRIIAWKRFLKLPPNNHFSIEWFINSAWIGAKDALSRCEVGKPGWKNYVGQRCSGQITDDMREFDEIPRLMRSRGEAPNRSYFSDMDKPNQDRFNLDSILPHATQDYRTDTDLWVEIRKIVGPRSSFALKLYYEAGMNMTEVGRAMDISESRVSQIMKGAIQTLQANASKVRELAGAA